MNCRSGKIRYRSLIEARLALLRCKRQSARRHSHRKEGAFYRCPYCFGFHLTSSPRRSRRRSNA